MSRARKQRGTGGESKLKVSAMHLVTRLYGLNMEKWPSVEKKE